MKRGWAWMLAVCTGFHAPGSMAAEHVEVSDAQIRALGIALDRPAPAEFAVGLALSARLVPAPDAQWTISARTDGVIERNLVTAGQRVRTGDPVVEIRSAQAVAYWSALRNA